MTKRARRIVALACGLVAASVCPKTHAADRSDWSRVTRLAPGTEVAVQEHGGATWRGLFAEASAHELTLLLLPGKRIPPELAKGLIDAHRNPSVSYTFRGMPIDASTFVKVIRRAAVRRIDRDGDHSGSRAAAIAIGTALGAGAGLLAGFHLGPVISGPCESCELGDYGAAMGGASIGFVAGGVAGYGLASRRTGPLYEAGPRGNDERPRDGFSFDSSR